VKGNKTPRAWSTFIAVPRQKGVKFSDVAREDDREGRALLSARPCRQSPFHRREGTVKVHDFKVIEENVPVPKK